VITLLCALVLAAGAMFAWDRHQPISIPLLFWHLKLPASLAQQRDDAMAQAAHAASEQQTCLASIRQQNAEITQVSVQGQAASAAAQAKLDAVSAVNDRLRAGAAKIKGLGIGVTPLGDPGRCAAWESVDQTVKGALQ
jgi:hypothetical protein